MSYYKSPLSIYVVWHPSYKEGLKFAEFIYDSFCRDINTPLTRALGIPIFFRYEYPPGGSTPIKINVEESDKNAIVLLIEDEMFLDSNWNSYVNDLLDQEDQKKTRIFPVALSKHAFSLNEERLNKKQLINLLKIIKTTTGCKNELSSEANSIDARMIELRSRLLHDLCRFFYQIPEVSDLDRQMSIEPPVKLFISHAKIDGEVLASEFRDYINSQTKLKTFFDVNDIADALDFEEQISSNLENSAIVVFQSDQYATREWCRIEVIIAKRNNSPLVVVNNIQKGEKRSFPYLGNVPTLRFPGCSFDEIIDLALYQVLNNLFIELRLKKEIALYDLEREYHVYCLENTPELFNFIDIKKLISKRDDARPLLVIYPEPSLGHEELRLLNDLDEQITFITPSLIYNIQNGR